MKKLISQLAFRFCDVFILFLALTGYGVSESAQASSGPQCYQYHSHIVNRDIHYCIDRTTPDQPMTPNEPVTYFMHGIDGDAHSWFQNNYSASLAQLRDSGQPLPPMSFISFDTAHRSFFTDYPGDPNRAWETMFITEFIPFIETTYGVCNQKQCRTLMGESMGGFGALKTALRHTDLFSAVAVNSPALPAFSARAPIHSWLGFFLHTKIGPAIGFFLLEVVRHIFINEADWEAQDPIHLCESVPMNQVPAIYFDMGGRDRFGFAAGYQVMVQQLNARGIPYTTHFEPRATHDMWKRHAGDAIEFVMKHATGQEITPPSDPVVQPTLPDSEEAPVLDEAEGSSTVQS